MKILIVRFSSIGDIVLTSPVARCLKTQLPETEIHYLTKPQYSTLVESSPYIDRVFTLGDAFSDLVTQLKKEQYDHIIDLHNNLRTHRLSLLLSVPYKRVNKENGIKLRMVYFKDRKVQNRHIVDRYLETCSFLGVKNDGKGLDYFYPDEFGFDFQRLPETHQNGYISIAIGGQHTTKKMPTEQIIELCKKIKKPLLILGGPEDEKEGHAIEVACLQAYNMAGKTNLHDSAWLVENSNSLITHDTGMMHIGAAFKKRIYALWGNTVPEFGMNPYMAAEGSMNLEVPDLRCRPCSKIGYDQCPKKHFRCMKDQNIDELVLALNS